MLKTTTYLASCMDSLESAATALELVAKPAGVLAAPR